MTAVPPLERSPKIMKSITTLIAISAFAVSSSTLRAEPERENTGSTAVVPPVIKKFEFPIDDDLETKLVAMTKRYECTLKKLLQDYGVEFPDGSTVSMDEPKNLIIGASDHKNGFYIMLVLAQISGQEMKELIRPESDDCGFNPPSKKN